MDELRIPRNVIAEQVILGCVLLDNGAMAEADALTLPDFSFEAHRIVWREMLALWRDRRALDPLTLQTALQASGDLARIGGTAFVASLWDGVPRFSRAADVAEYVRLLRDASISRQLMYAAREILGAVDEAAESGSQQLAAAQTRLAQIDAGVDTALMTDEQVTHSTLTLIEERMAGRAAPLRTGFPDLDRLIIGMEPGDLVLIGGLRGVGKSAFAHNMVDRIWRQSRVASLILSLEMNAERVKLRQLASAARVGALKLRAGQLSMDELRRVAMAADDAATGAVWSSSATAVTLDSIERLVVQAKRMQSCLGVVMIDYLQLMVGESSEGRAVAVNAATKRLKQVALRQRLSLVALCGLNRDLERQHRPPRNSDLDYGGEKDADMVLMLYDPADYTSPQRRELHITKQRDGPTGVVQLGFDGEYSSFYEWLGPLPEKGGGF